ncbi:MAG: SRPBCC family protein [Pseudomonadota bacterium]|nr:SRPBCC family protein [Pseudomonadota bacterium]
MKRTQIIPRPRADVFAFFADAGNLERITPPFLNFKILSDLPIDMRTGALIDYQLSLYKIPIKWRTEIGIYEPNVRFTDTQLRGPYKYWHHLHEFKDVPEGTEMVDIVDYEIPLGFLGTFARQIFVKQNLKTIFDYRRDTIADYFAS